MHGTGPPLVTPFDEEGALDEDRLRDLVGWVEERGVDFVVPCGSTSEAELMSVEERARVVETVVEEAGVPVVAGTGHPGYRETVRQTELAAEAGADAALVVTPFYYDHDQSALERYYTRLAREVDLPIYLYSVPLFTGVRISPEVVGRLATHENVVGLKDSSGDLHAAQREVAMTRDADFDVLVGSGRLYAHSLDAGAVGGILALANVAPERASEIRRVHEDGDEEEARRINRDLMNLDRVTTTHGIPGLKAAMRIRGAPAGYSRAPFEDVDEDDAPELHDLVKAAER